MEYDLIGNAMNSLNEGIDFYKGSKKYKDGSRSKYCVLLLAHSVRLILKEILFTESEYLLYQNIDDINENNRLTIGFGQSFLHVKNMKII